MKKILLLMVLFLSMFSFLYIGNYSTAGHLGAQVSPSDEILAAHNKYRSELDIPALKWSDNLAKNAKAWADKLASEGGRNIYHSKGTGEGENIWWGTSGYFSYTQMVDGWGGEKKYFKYGTFPEVSTSGNWADVGHYTQVIWKNTTEVGCGKASAGGYDIFVCRYSPPGNYMGQKPY